MAIKDIYTILNSIHDQATGQSAMVATDTKDFVSQATTTLQAGVDTAYNALMQVTMRPIFAVRDYSEKFSGLYLSSEEYGAIRRKISFADKGIPAGEEVYHPIDGTAVDHYVINKAEPVEMRFYGSATYEDWLTVFEDQVKTAFSAPNELSAFITAQVTHQNNKYKQWREELARATMVNFIAAKMDLNNGVVHLLTEYNTETGLSLTTQDIWKPQNVGNFFRWVRARINNLARMMNERSGEFQVTLTGKKINRHTPYADMRMYISAKCLDQIDTMVNTVTYHNEPLAYADVEAVSYWQDIKNPTSFNVTPNEINATGAVVDASAAVTTNDLFGIIFDRDAIGINQEMYSITNTPMNARGHYFNTFLVSRNTYMNDLSEKACILLLN